jgi:hypothetical protein
MLGFLLPWIPPTRFADTHKKKALKGAFFLCVSFCGGRKAFFHFFFQLHRTVVTMGKNSYQTSAPLFLLRTHFPSSREDDLRGVNGKDLKWLWKLISPQNSSLNERMTMFPA